jgi:hypothetical protein
VKLWALVLVSFFLFFRGLHFVVLWVFLVHFPFSQAVLWNTRPAVLPEIVHENFCGALAGSLKTGVGWWPFFGLVHSLSLHEFSSTPSSPFSQWPSLRTMGNLIWSGYPGTTDRMWPYTYITPSSLSSLRSLPLIVILLSLDTTDAMSTPLQSRQIKMGSCLQRLYTRRAKDNHKLS